MGSKKKIENPTPAVTTYSDSVGTYDVDSMLAWVDNNHDKWSQLKVREFLPHAQLDTWVGSSSDLRSNLTHLMKAKDTREKILQANSSYPIVITNYNRVIDGTYRILKAIYEGQETISVIFINQSTLNNFRIITHQTFPQTGQHLPIPDQYLKIPKSRLPAEKEERRDVLETYFADHLPFAREEEDGWLIGLERPQEHYGCYTHDSSIYSGLEWWAKGTQIDDIPFRTKLFNNGLLALEDQWMPYSWSRCFQKLGQIPPEVILLHLDDHQDMMMPRIGKRLDGKLFDYITGDSLSLDDPSSVRAATISGAIGKGSILVPLIWSVEKIHVRHLCFRPHAHPYDHIQNRMYPDGVLSETDNRIGIYFEPTSADALQSSSNYTVTPDVEEWLRDLPVDVPILFHIDMDYFNNRFDGSSDWQEEGRRSYESSIETQLEQIKLVFSHLKKKKLARRIIDTSIGISPGFYPGEFWSSTIPEVLKACEKIGIKL